MDPDQIQVMQVIINGIILLIYFFMLLTNFKMVRETKGMAQEAIITREQAYRPEVIAYIREENEFLYFHVQNIGARPALNIHIQIKNYFYNTEHEGNSEQHEAFFKQIPGTTRDVEKDISLLAPNQDIESYMGFREYIVQKNLNVNRTLQITYFNYEEELYTEEYTLSLNDFARKAHFKEDNLEVIANELKKIKEKINK